jgi:periplasmic divalent cation tolerance protein
MSQPYVALITMPSVEKAVEIAYALVEERLAACVNLVPGLRSIYRWEGEISDDPEVLCLVKTTDEVWERLRARVVALHPYETPEIIALPVAAGHDPYLAWLRDAVAVK